MTEPQRTARPVDRRWSPRPIRSATLRAMKIALAVASVASFGAIVLTFGPFQPTPTPAATGPLGFADSTVAPGVDPTLDVAGAPPPDPGAPIAIVIEEIIRGPRTTAPPTTAPPTTLTPTTTRYVPPAIPDPAPAPPPPPAPTPPPAPAPTPPPAPPVPTTTPPPPTTAAPAPTTAAPPPPTTTPPGPPVTGPS